MLRAIAGLFDFSAGSEFVGKEIVKCVGMAQDEIHAALVVFSVRSRFSQEEEATLHSLQTLFGKNCFDYMIVVFSGRDELEANDETLEDYLGRECPKPLKVCFERQQCSIISLVILIKLSLVGSFVKFWTPLRLDYWKFNMNICMLKILDRFIVVQPS